MAVVLTVIATIHIVFALRADRRRCRALCFVRCLLSDDTACFAFARSLWPSRSRAPGAIARADFFSTSPGPLAQAHANIDGKDHCQDCHVGSRDVAIDKCLDCHKPIAERQRERKGVHASPKALGKQCELCHTDHKGRDKDILGFQSFGGQRAASTTTR